MKRLGFMSMIIIWSFSFAEKTPACSLYFFSESKQPTIISPHDDMETPVWGGWSPEDSLRFEGEITIYRRNSDDLSAVALPSTINFKINSKLISSGLVIKGELLTHVQMNVEWWDRGAEDKKEEIWNQQTYDVYHSRDTKHIRWDRHDNDEGVIIPEKVEKSLMQAYLTNPITNHPLLKHSEHMTGVSFSDLRFFLNNPQDDSQFYVYRGSREFLYTWRRMDKNGSNSQASCSKCFMLSLSEKDFNSETYLRHIIILQENPVVIAYQSKFFVMTNGNQDWHHEAMITANFIETERILEK